MRSPEAVVTHMLSMPGPQFLLVYAGTAVVVFLLLRAAIARIESTGFVVDARQIRDPYLIAYLRGGLQEHLKVVIAALILRGQLQITGRRLLACSPAAAPGAHAPIEQAVLGACAEPVTASALAGWHAVRAAAREYQNQLMAQGLIASPKVYRARAPLVLLAIALLVIFAGAKISVALATGHRNITFLVLLMLVAVIAVLGQLPGRRTEPGRRVLADLAQLFRDLERRRTIQVHEPAEAVLLAAVYGMYMLPGVQRSAWSGLWATSGGGADGGSSTCGGGDGGGSGGGGGGGCGGCGS